MAAAPASRQCLQWEALAQPVTLATEDLQEGHPGRPGEAGAGVPGGVTSAESAGAVEDEPLAGDVPGRVGGEERHRVGDVVRGAEPAGRGRGDVRGPLIGADVLMSLDRDEARVPPCSP